MAEVTPTVLVEVRERAESLGTRIYMRAWELARSGGLELAADPEDLATVLLVSALMDVAEQIERQAKTAPRLRKAINNLRHF